MSTHRTTPRPVLAVITALLLATAACGDDGGGAEVGDQSATEPTSTTVSTEVSSIEPLDVPGAVPLPRPRVEPTAALEPATYTTSVLGTEIAFTVPDDLELGDASPGIIGMNRGEDVVLLSRPDASRYEGADIAPPELDRPQQYDIDAYLDQLADVDGVQVDELEDFEVDGRSVRVADVTSAREIELGGQLEPDRPSRVWVIDQDGWTPILVRSTSTGAWADEIDELVRTMRVGAPTATPGLGSDEPWLFGSPGAAGPGPVTVPVLDGLRFTVPREVDLPPGSGNSTQLVLEGSGISPPTVWLSQPGTLLGPGTVLPVTVERAGDVGSVDQVRPAFEAAEDLTPVAGAPTILGAEGGAFDFVAGTAEIPLYLVDANEWQRESSDQLVPNTEGRVWLVDTERGPLVIRAEAEVATPDDLEAAIETAEAIIASLELTSS